MCVFMSVHTPQCTRGGQRTVCKSQVSPLPREDRAELRSSGLATSVITHSAFLLTHSSFKVGLLSSRLGRVPTLPSHPPQSLCLLNDYIMPICSHSWPFSSDHSALFITLIVPPHGLTQGLGCLSLRRDMRIQTKARP